jgi:hypothetical protein
MLRRAHRGLGGSSRYGGDGTMQEEREEREQYMDSLERQMEHEREQIQRTLDRMTEDSDRRRKALEKLRSALPSFPSRTPVRGASEREEPIEPIGSETPSAREESPRRKPSEPRSRWRRMFGGS